MSQPSAIPKYCRHKASGRAYVRVRGRVVYCGRYGTADSKREYARIVAEIAASTLPPAVQFGEQISIVELCAAYLDYAAGYYRKNGEPTRTMEQVRQAIRAVKDLYGHQAAADFSPLKLLAIQNKLAAAGSTRSYVNKLVGEIKRIFKWGVSRELVPPQVFTALSTVEGLRMGRSSARESKPVLPVADDVVEATLPYMPQIVAAMVRFQRLTGARPGEVCMVRPCDVDRSGGEVWTYRPESHKTEHQGRERTIYIGPQTQAILLPYLLRDAEAHCFSPAESEGKRHGEQREQRRSRVQPSQRNRRKAKPQRTAGERYLRTSYANAIKRAVIRANRVRTGEAKESGEEPVLLPHWHPNQLRHSSATEIRRQFGLEAAQVLLGHAKADVTQVYAERDTRLALEVAKCIG